MLSLLDFGYFFIPIKLAKYNIDEKILPKSWSKVFSNVVTRVSALQPLEFESKK